MTVDEGELFDWELRERHDEDSAAAGYQESYHGSPIARRWDEAFFEFVRAEVAEGDRVLDLGCGPASMWDWWKGFPVLRCLVGADLSRGMIEEARRRYPDGEFHVARAHALPFAAGSFDVVVASAFLHHIPPVHLDGALAEVERVLDEHGKLVGRDPASEHAFGREPGWFSGAIMSFRHFVYRRTHSREFPEPELGEHHHVPATEEFLRAIGTRLTVTRAETRFPFSNYLQRVRSDAVAALALRLDDLLHDRAGSILHYTAEKNFVRHEDLNGVIDAARHEIAPAISDVEFLAYLAAASAEVEKIFGRQP